MKASNENTTGLNLARARVRNEIAIYYNDGPFTNYDSLLAYAKQALEICRENNGLDSEEGSKAFYRVARGFMQKSQYDSAEHYALQGLTLRKTLKDLKGQAIMINLLGLIYGRQKNSNKQLVYYKKALKIDEQLGDLKEVATMSYNIGLTYHDQGRYDSALHYAKKMLEVAHQQKDSINIGYAEYLFAVVYDAYGQPYDALKAHERALNIRKKMRNQTAELESYNGIANVYFNDAIKKPEKKLLKTDSAEYYFLKALAIARKIGITVYINVLKNNLAAYYRKVKKEYSKALDHLKDVRQSLKSTSPTRMVLVQNYLNTAGLYREVKQYDSAVFYGQKAYQLVKKDTSNFIYKSRSYRGLYETYKANKQTSQALKFHELWMQAKDSIFQKEKTEYVTKWQTKYETEKKEATIKLQDQQLKTEQAETQKQVQFRNFSLVLALALLGLFGAAGNSYLGAKKNVKLEKKNVEQEKKNVEQEKKIKKLEQELREGIGHDISSVFPKLVDSVDKELAKTKNADEKTKIQVLDRLLNFTKTIIDDIKDVNRFLKDYDPESNKTSEDILLSPNLILANLKKRQEIYKEQKEVYRLVDIESDMIPIKMKARHIIKLFMIIREFFTNACKYAFENVEKPTVKVTLKDLNSEKILFKFEDNGIGFDPEAKAKGTGIGRRWIHEQIDYFIVDLEKDYTLETQKNKGTTYTIIIDKKRIIK